MVLGGSVATALLALLVLPARMGAGAEAAAATSGADAV
jgi:hypothetical protein